MTGVADRIAGCLLGGALGDALGAAIEFDSIEVIRRRHGVHGVQGLVPAYGRRGAITDDTQMTLFTVEGIIRASVRFRSKGICHAPTVVRHAPRPDSFEPSEAWIRHLIQRLDNLEVLCERDRNEARERMAKIEERADAADKDLRTAIGDVEEKLERSIGGEGGRGLDRAWWGLAITLVGVFLQSLAMGLS